VTKKKKKKKKKRKRAEQNEKKKKKGGKRPQIENLINQGGKYETKMKVKRGPKVRHR